MLRCAGRVAVLLGRRRLHIDEPLADRATLPDGRVLTVFRQTSCDGEPAGGDVTLAVWFHLRGVPPGSRVRRWIFERESILNTVLYAGVPGFRTKLWLVDPESCDYAGLYGWCGAAAAEHYGRYISAVLRPLSVRGSIGYQVVEGTRLVDHLRAHPAR
jgi:hypothetical protein